jgi:hypothetical protein
VSCFVASVICLCAHVAYCSCGSPCHTLGALVGLQSKRQHANTSMKIVLVFNIIAYIFSGTISSWKVLIVLLLLRIVETYPFERGLKCARYRFTKHVFPRCLLYVQQCYLPHAAAVVVYPAPTRVLNNHRRTRVTRVAIRIAHPRRRLRRHLLLIRHNLVRMGRAPVRTQ